MSNKQLNLDQIDLVDELHYEPLERKFISVQFVKVSINYLFLLILPFFLLLVEDFNYRIPILIGAECVILLAGLINLWFLPKAYSYKGYAVREHDITYRSGIIFPSTMTIPFCKIQQVSIQQNPIARIFGLYSLEVVNGAQMLTQTTIPGLSEKRANEMKSLLTERINQSTKTEK